MESPTTVTVTAKNQKRPSGSFVEGEQEKVPECYPKEDSKGMIYARGTSAPSVWIAWLGEKDERKPGQGNAKGKGHPDEK